MKSRKEAIHFCLKKQPMIPTTDQVSVFAPANLAMIKYWGKRNIALNLPMTSSLSLSLKDKGTFITLAPKSEPGLSLKINDKIIASDNKIFKRLNDYLSDFPFYPKLGLNIESHSNIPIGAGLASSSSAFAAIVKGLNDLFSWHLNEKMLSILARLGSGSAARSFWDGFVIWHQGEDPDGMDSFAEPLAEKWDALKIGLLILEHAEKPIGSTEAMIRTTQTSKLYKSWPQKVTHDLETIQKAIQEKDFLEFGKIAEENALFMHQTMADAVPQISYATEKTHETISKIYQLRKEGLNVFFTQDAGPNIKLIYLEKDVCEIKKQFEKCIII